MGEAVTAPHLYTFWQIAVAVTIITFFGALFITVLYFVIDKLTRWITKGEQHGATTQTENDTERRLPASDDVHGQAGGADQTGGEANEESNGIPVAGLQHLRGPENVPEVPGDIQPAQTAGEDNAEHVDGSRGEENAERGKGKDVPGTPDSDTRRVSRRPPAHVRQTLRRAASTEDHDGSLNSVINAFLQVFGGGK